MSEDFVVRARRYCFVRAIGVLPVLDDGAPVLAARAPVTVDDGAPIATSFPDFLPLMRGLGAGIAAEPSAA